MQFGELNDALADNAGSAILDKSVTWNKRIQGQGWDLITGKEKRRKQWQRDQGRG